MADDKSSSEEQKTTESSLEEESTTPVTDDAGSLEQVTEDEKANQAKEDAARASQKKSFSDRILKLTKGVNLYLLGFGVILAIAGLVTFIAMTSDNTEDAGLTIEGTELTQEALDELLNKDSNIGGVTETLTVEANAIFNGKVLVKDSLDVAGELNIGGALSLTGLNVTGDTTLQNVGITGNSSINGNSDVSGNLSVAGTAAVQSNLTVAGDVSIGGALSAGSLNVDSIQFSNDLQILRHIDTGGSTPSASRGGAIGGAGTVSVSGSDTAGTVTINTGGGASSGTLITVNFANAFNRTPVVIISPVGSTTSTLNYYVTRTSTSFTISTSNAASNSTTYVFDYWVAE